MSDEAQKTGPRTDPIEGLATAPTIFAEGFQGVFLRNGVMHVNLIVIRNDPVAQKEFRSAPAILAMPIADFVNSIDALAATIAQFEKDGIIVRNAPDGTPGQKPASH